MAERRHDWVWFGRFDILNYTTNRLADDVNNVCMYIPMAETETETLIQLMRVESGIGLDWKRPSDRTV